MKLSAILIFDNGNAVTDLSQSMEPPLLGGEAILSNGEALFELRITVLSSLCRGSKFRVRVTAVDRHAYRVITGPIRTITKLHRMPARKAKLQKTSGEGSVRDTLTTELATLLPGDTLEWSASLFDVCATAELSNVTTDRKVVCTERTHEDIWDEVSANNALILELQNQQAALFEQLRHATRKV